MIQSKGFLIENFYIPPFEVLAGEIILIEIPNGPDYESLSSNLFEILSGAQRNNNVELKAEFKVARHIIETGWKRIFRPLTVSKYIKQKGNPKSSLPQKIYEKEYINPKTRIITLPGGPRKILSLLTTLSLTDKIIFDLSGVDPQNGEEAFALVRRELGRWGSAILIDHCDEFKDSCTRAVKYELVNTETST